MRHQVRFGLGAVTALLVVAGLPVPAHADEIRDDQWMLNALDIERAHQETRGAGVTIGIVDSGVDATHPDLKGNVEAGLASWEGGKDGLKDTMGHGTAMASILVGHGHGDGGEDGVLGIAPEAKVKSVSIYPSSDPRDDPRGSHDRMVEGIRWLADEGVDVISVSQGGAGSDELEEAVKYAIEEKGVPVVASAGNTAGGVAGDVVVQAPAVYDNVFGVTGTTKQGEFWDGSVDGTSPQDVTVAAPAEDVVHAWKNHGYDDNSGTSDSAAVVAGTVALMKAQWPDMPWELIEWRLAMTADDKGKEGSDVKYGWGIVNPVAALTEDVKVPKGYSDEEVNPEPGPKEEPSTSSSDDKALTGADSSSGLAVWISVGAGIAILTAAVVGFILIRRRKQPPAA